MANIAEYKEIVRVCYETRTPLFCWGDTGIGKSEITSDFVINELGLEVVDFRGAMIEATDLQGYPEPDMEEKVMRFLQWDLLPRDPNWKGVIVLEEPNRSPKAVIQAFYGLADKTRGFNDYKLPEGASVICLGNPPTDDYDVATFDKSFKARFIHVVLEPQAKEWIKYAKNVEVHPVVLGFVETEPQVLGEIRRYDPKVESYRRTVKLLSNMMNKIDELGISVSEKTLTELVKGSIGIKNTAAFIEYYKQQKLFKIDHNFIASDYKKIKKIVAEAIKNHRMDVIKKAIDDFQADDYTTIIKKMLSKGKEKNLIDFSYDIPADLAYTFLEGITDLNDQKVENDFLDMLNSNGVCDRIAEKQVPDDMKKQMDDILNLKDEDDKNDK